MEEALRIKLETMAEEFSDIIATRVSMDLFLKVEDHERIKKELIFAFMRGAWAYEAQNGRS
jgi:hypothetical protein